MPINVAIFSRPLDLCCIQYVVRKRLRLFTSRKEWGHSTISLAIGHKQHTSMSYLFVLCWQTFWCILINTILATTKRCVAIIQSFVSVRRSWFYATHHTLLSASLFLHTHGLRQLYWRANQRRYALLVTIKIPARQWRTSTSNQFRWEWDIHSKCQTSTGLRLHACRTWQWYKGMYAGSWSHYLLCHLLIVIFM